MQVLLPSICFSARENWSPELIIHVQAPVLILYLLHVRTYNRFDCAEFTTEVIDLSVLSPALLIPSAISTDHSVRVLSWGVIPEGINSHAHNNKMFTLWIIIINNIKHSLLFFIFWDKQQPHFTLLPLPWPHPSFFRSSTFTMSPFIYLPSLPYRRGHPVDQEDTPPPVMLLRNLDPIHGRCNGTQITILRASTRCLEVRLNGGFCLGCRLGLFALDRDMNWVRRIWKEWPALISILSGCVVLFITFTQSSRVIQITQSVRWLCKLPHMPLVWRIQFPLSLIIHFSFVWRGPFCIIHSHKAQALGPRCSMD